MLKNKYYHAEEVLKRFHLNSHRISSSDLKVKTPSFTLAEHDYNNYSYS